MKQHISHKLFLILSIVVTLMLSTTVALAQGGAPPPGISYQGRVTVNGQPFDGTGFFMFAIVDSQGQLTWTSDLPVSAQGGTQLPAPTQPIALPVSRGLFSVRLGEFGLMNLIPSQALLDPQSSLRVWFSSDGGAFTQLPDRALAAAPYAMNAYALDGYEASDFAGANHNHWSETWSGGGTGLELNSSNGWGLDVSTGGSSQYATAVRGQASAGSGETIGVWGSTESASDGTVGVWGQAGKNNGIGYGVLGQTFSNNADSAGVKGTATSGAGVYGTAPMTGTVGIATNSDGPTWGVYGRSDAPSGYGVYGENTSAGVTYGVYGKNRSDRGAGIFGISSHENGIGVHGETISGRGVEGIVDWTKPHGTGVGVYGSGGFYGRAGLFENASITQTTLVVNNMMATSYGPALDVTGAANFRDGNIYITKANSDGVFIDSAIFNGVHVAKASLSGFVIEDAGNAAYLVMPEEVWPYKSTHDGMDIYGAADHGIFIGYAGRSGIEINEVAGNGLEVWNAHASGVVAQAGVHGGYFQGQQDGVDGETDSSDHEWGVTTEDKMYAGAGYVSGSSMMLVAKSSDAGDLETGDVVAVAGMAFAPGESRTPIPLVRRAGRGSATAVVGVVYRRFVFEKHVEKFEHEGKVTQRTSIRTNSADGPIAPGDYLLIIVLGPAQLKANASSTIIGAGDPVTVDDNGRAMKAAPLRVNGVEFYAPGTVIGKAMEPLKKGTGLIYVFVTLH